MRLAADATGRAWKSRLRAGETETRPGHARDVFSQKSRIDRAVVGWISAENKERVDLNLLAISRESSARGSGPVREPGKEGLVKFHGIWPEVPELLIDPVDEGVNRRGFGRGRRKRCWHLDVFEDLKMSAVIHSDHSAFFGIRGRRAPREELRAAGQRSRQIFPTWSARKPDAVISHRRRSGSGSSGRRRAAHGASAGADSFAERREVSCVCNGSETGASPRKSPSRLKRFSGAIEVIVRFNLLIEKRGGPFSGRNPR